MRVHLQNMCYRSYEDECLDNRLSRCRACIRRCERHPAGNMPDDDRGNDFVQLCDELMIGPADSEVTFIDENKFLKVEPMRQDDSDFFIQIDAFFFGRVRDLAGGKLASIDSGAIAAAM